MQMGYRLLAGLADVGYHPCHYCPKGHTHSLINDSDAGLTFLAVIPEQP